MTAHPTTSSSTEQERPTARPRRRKRPAGFALRRGLLYLMLALIAAVFLGPFLLLLSTGLKPIDQPVYSFPPQIIPMPPVLTWLHEAWNAIPFARMLLNSVIYTVITVPLYLLVSAMTAYPLARVQFPGRSLFFLMFLSIMFMPAELMLVPRFLVMTELGLTDTYAAVILPALLSSLGIFLLRQTFADIPREVIEAARIDGASEWGIFASVVVPMAKPTMALLSILGFISVWNSFVWPLVVLTSQEKFPITLGIAYLSGVSGTDVRGLAAGTMVSLIPVIAVFMLLQRRILSSMGGAVKG